MYLLAGVSNLNPTLNIERRLQRRGTGQIVVIGLNGVDEVLYHISISRDYRCDRPISRVDLITTFHAIVLLTIL